MEWNVALKIKKMVPAKVLNLLKNNIIKVTDKAFDDFAAVNSSKEFNRKNIRTLITSFIQY